MINNYKDSNIIKKYPDFLIEKIDLNNNYIYAYTGVDLGDKQQWRWFATNILSMYVPIYKNFKIFIFISKKQLLKYLELIEKKDELLKDTKQALKVVIENDSETTSIWTNPLLTNGELVSFKKSVDEKNEQNYYFEKFIDNVEFVDLSFKIEKSIIGVSENNKAINDIFISINKQSNIKFYIHLIVAFTNLFYQGKTIRDIAAQIKIDKFLTRFLFGEKNTVVKISNDFSKDKDIKDLLYEKSDFIYSNFIASEEYKTNIFESSIIISPYGAEKSNINYEPVFFCLPIDKEYFGI